MTRPARLAHVVALVAADGTYGGPTTVALAQTAALADRADVTLVSGWDGRWRPADGRVRHVLRRARWWRSSFGTLVSPGVLLWVLRHARRQELVHVHLARDLTTMPAALLCRVLRVPYVVQTHGMIKPARSRVLAVYDALLTRPVLRGAALALTLTDTERAALGDVAPGLRLVAVRNAVPPAAAGGGSDGDVHVVGFCSRLHPRKRVLAWAEGMLELTRRAPGRFRGVVVGPDGGDLDSLRRWLADHPDVDVQYRGAVPPQDVPRVLAGLDVLVLPSEAEPFPMVVLEALSVGTPVVVDPSCGLASIVASSDGARVAAATPGALATAVADLVGQGTAGRAAARDLAEQEFGLAALADRLLDEYATAGGGAPWTVSPV